MVVTFGIYVSTYLLYLCYLVYILAGPPGLVVVNP
jgi:hypothetical protein